MNAFVVKDGILYEMVPVLKVDQIAQANGELNAERFCDKYEGKLLVTDGLKIVRIK